MKNNSSEAGQSGSDAGIGLVKVLKYKILDGLRAARILRLVDELHYWVHRYKVAGTNAEFIRNNPDFRLPPYELAFDAYNSIDWRFYKQYGNLHASIFSDTVKSVIPPGEISILEWGCGPGRLIRHWDELLPGYSVKVTGADYNSRTIDWCRENLPEKEFVKNELMPPIALGDAQFDVVYCFSVFTHLSWEAQQAWAAELKRLLKPGGLFICTTHGDKCRHLLTTKADRETYDAGGMVLKGQYVEGRKWYFSVHPEKFVTETLLAGYTDISKVDVTQDETLLQDVWSGRKPSD
jgi:SAM-dependent methyltransferase